MALVQQALKATLQAAFKRIELKAQETNTAAELQELYADELSKAIFAWIKTADIVVSPGIAVSTAGTAAAQVGATTAPGKGIII